MKNIKLQIMIIFMTIIFLVIVFLYSQNNLLAITKISFVSDRLPKGFNGYKIVHLSDLHCKNFGKNNWILLSKIKKINPQIIIITGDLINTNYYDETNIILFMTGLRKVSPVFYVTGNHELGNTDFPNLEQKLRLLGIEILRNSSVSLNYNGETIILAGIDDPITTSMSENNFENRYLSKEIRDTLAFVRKDDFKILLSHRPEAFLVYAENKIDLTFTGHAHGGQIRVPFIGGLVAPNQGLFPKYTSGKYIENNSAMIVSRGLGNTSFPQRIFNRPEIVVATLYKK